MSQTAQDFFKKGISFCEKGEFEAAIDLFNEVLRLDKSNPEALYNRAKAHFKLQNFVSAINDFSSLIDHRPQEAFYYSERGVAYYLSGKNLKALNDLDKAAALEPQKPFRYSSRAFIKERLGDLKGAIADYEKAIELDPEDAIAYNNKGLVEEKLGYLDTSKKSFEKADRLDPKKQEPEKLHTAIRSKPLKKNEPAASDKNSLTLSSYLSTWKQLLTSSKEQKEFVTFVKKIARKKR